MFVEERPVVVRTAENDSMRSDLHAGDVILDVNGRTSKEIVKTWSLLAPASNEVRRMYNIGQLMLRTNDTTLSVGIDRNGKRMTLTVRCYEGSQAALQAKTRMREMWKRLPGDVGYIFPGVIKNDSLESIIASLKETKGPPLPKEGRTPPPGMEVNEFTAPFGVDITFDVEVEQPGCVRVYEISPQDGHLINVVQVPVLLQP